MTGFGGQRMPSLDGATVWLDSGPLGPAEPRVRARSQASGPYERD
jgi:hypothetical protein